MKQPLAIALRLVTAAGLAYQSYVHFEKAPTYDAVRSDLVSQGDLFRVEAVAAALAAVLVLVVQRWWSALIAAGVAGGGFFAVVLYRYVDVGPVLGLPNMYEPVWYDMKTWSAVAEGVAAVTALALVASAGVLRKRPRR